MLWLYCLLSQIGMIPKTLASISDMILRGTEKFLTTLEVTEVIHQKAFFGASWVNLWRITLKVVIKPQKWPWAHVFDLKKISKHAMALLFAFTDWYDLKDACKYADYDLKWYTKVFRHSWSQSGDSLKSIFWSILSQFMENYFKSDHQTPKMAMSARSRS